PTSAATSAGAAAARSVPPSPDSQSVARLPAPPNASHSPTGSNRRSSPASAARIARSVASVVIGSPRPDQPIPRLEHEATGAVLAELLHRVALEDAEGHRGVVPAAASRRSKHVIEFRA